MTEEKASVPAIFGAMLQARVALKSIPKTKTNEKYKYMFRGIDDVMKALKPVLDECKIVGPIPSTESHLIQAETFGSTKMQVATVVVTWTFTSVDDGSELIVGPVVGQAFDAGDKAMGKAYSMAMKTAMIQAFCIPTEDIEDADNEPMDQELKDAVYPEGKRKKEAENGFIPWAELGRAWNLTTGDLAALCRMALPTSLKASAAEVKAAAEDADVYDSETAVANRLVNLSRPKAVAAQRVILETLAKPEGAALIAERRARREAAQA